LKQYLIDAVAYIPLMMTICLMFFGFLGILAPLWSLREYIVISMTIGLILGAIYSLQKEKEESEQLKEALEIAAVVNPISVCIWIGPAIYYGIILGAVWLRERLLDVMEVVPGWLTKTLKMLCLFVWNLYILIHSKSRAMVLVDTIIAITVGYIVGMTTSYSIIACSLIGAAIGPILFIINKEIVASRLLKLKPANCAG